MEFTTHCGSVSPFDTGPLVAGALLVLFHSILVMGLWLFAERSTARDVFRAPKRTFRSEVPLEEAHLFSSCAARSFGTSFLEVLMFALTAFIFVGALAIAAGFGFPPALLGVIAAAVAVIVGAAW